MSDKFYEFLSTFTPIQDRKNHDCFFCKQAATQEYKAHFFCDLCVQKARIADAISECQTAISKPISEEMRKLDKAFRQDSITGKTI